MVAAADVAAPIGRPITGSMIRDVLKCEHRAALDLTGDPALRDPVGAFTAMLWEDGIAHERGVLSAFSTGSVDLRGLSGGEREAATTAAMRGRAGIILGARIRHGDMLGDPDVLVREADGWEAGDVKSGAALEGGRPRPAYAAQVAHYASILAGAGAGDGRRAFVVGGDGARTDYALDLPAGPRSPPPAEAHGRLLGRARAIRDGAATRPALAAECKGCHWKSLCRSRLVEEDDPTLVAELGRTARDALGKIAPTVKALAALEPTLLAGGDAPRIAGVGAQRLARFAERARLLIDPGTGAYARAPLPLARADRELFLDVETDPLDDHLVYLHGVLERIPAGETFHAFFADDGRDGERDAFADAMRLLGADPVAPVYVYSAYERTTYARLQRRYPDVCDAEAIERLFDPTRTIDLLNAIVRPLTEWPAHDRSIKSLARLCGFEWCDADPSGANSIEWFRRWTATRDPAIRKRIVRYNEDDVIATRVLLDALLALPVRRI